MVFNELNFWFEEIQYLACSTLLTMKFVIKIEKINFHRYFIFFHCPSIFCFVFSLCKHLLWISMDWFLMIVTPVIKEQIYVYGFGVLIKGNLEIRHSSFLAESKQVRNTCSKNIQSLEILPTWSVSCKNMTLLKLLR